MKKITLIGVIFTFILNIGFAQTIKTVPKKSYYDYFNTKIKMQWNETADGKWHGSSVSYYESGKVLRKSTYYLDNLIQESEFYETGQPSFVFNKNKDGKYIGEQKGYKLANGVSILTDYANFNNGELMTYYCYNTPTTYWFSYNNKIYKEYDKNGKVTFSVNNNKINGTAYLFKKYDSDGLFYADEDCKDYIKVENNLITEIKRKNSLYTILPNKTGYEYKEFDGEKILVKGNYTLKSDSCNYIVFCQYRYDTYYQKPTIKFYFNLKNAENCYTTENIRIDDFLVKDSVWLSENSSYIWEEEFKNGVEVRYKLTDKETGKIKETHERKEDGNFYSISYDKNGNVIDFLTLDKDGKTINSPAIAEAKKEMELAKAKKEMEMAKAKKEMEMAKAKKQEELNKSKAELNDAIGGRGENIIELMNTIDRSYINAISEATTKGDDDIAIINDQINLYNRLVEAINKVGVKKLNKDCKGMASKDDLVKLLDSYMNAQKKSNQFKKILIEGIVN